MPTMKAHLEQEWRQEGKAKMKAKEKAPQT